MRSQHTGRMILMFMVVLAGFSVLWDPQPLQAGDAAVDSAIERRIEGLLARMTLEEKIGQMHQVSGISDESRELVRQGRIGSFLNVRDAKEANEVQKIAVEESRLRIPLIIGKDVIHGYRTIFPIPLAEASTWDPDLVEKAAAVAAREARASGTNWTFAPMADIARDPRWGRIAEGSGEDPVLGAAMAAARVRGFQGQDLAAPSAVVACPKHYVAYGGGEGGRDYNTVEMSLATLRNVYLPPFQAAVEAGAGTVMSAFNELNGVPASANPFTLTKILKNEWAFDGFVVSDWNSVGELLNHGIAATPAEAGQKAAQAGVDMDMQGFIYIEHLAGLVRIGAVPEQTIDEAVWRILRIKFRLGLFDHPYVDPQLEKTVLLSKEHLDMALEVAQKSIVLLKNDKGLLPLNANIKSLALIGPLADNRLDPLGCWACEGRKEDVVTVLQGIEGKIPKERIHYVKGCDIEGRSSEDVAGAVKLARKADVAIVVVGESAAMSGEAACRSSLDLPGRQQELVEAIQATGVPTVVVLMNGRPLSTSWIADHVPAIVETWFLGTQCGRAIADVLFGDVNPGGRLPVSVPRTVGQVPIYYNHKNTGRPAAEGKYSSKYLDVVSTPLFPFGYGLSYTTFAYSDLQITANGQDDAASVSVSAQITNTGDRPGDEVVQLYLQDVAGSLTRPVREMKGLQRILLKPGESRRVEFVLQPQAFGFYNEKMDFVTEPGLFKIWVGPNSVEGLEEQYELIQQ